MNRTGAAVDIIRSSVSALDAGQALGLNPDRYGRCACPIHGGKDRNMKLFKGDKGYYCFVCHSGGDVIDLVTNALSCTFQEAVTWLSDAFHLGVDIHKPVSVETLRRAENAARRRRERAERRERTDRELYDLYLNASDLYWRLTEWQERYAPEAPWDAVDRRFVAAVKWLPDAVALLKDIEDEMTGGPDETN